MKILPHIAAILALGGALVCAAQDKGYWRAASSTASSITGDIGISGTKLILNNFYPFPIVRARNLIPAEVGAVFDADVNTGATGILYHVSIPANRRFLHKNTLCGTEDTQWMATYALGNTLQVAFFSGQQAPVFTMDAISHSSDLCGTFTYAR